MHEEIGGKQVGAQPSTPSYSLRICLIRTAAALLKAAKKVKKTRLMSSVDIELLVLPAAP